MGLRRLENIIGTGADAVAGKQEFSGEDEDTCGEDAGCREAGGITAGSKRREVEDAGGDQKDSALQPRDVNVVLQGLKGGKRIRGITESVLESGLESAGEATEGRLMESVAAPMVESMAESTAESMVGKTVVESMAWSTLKSSVESTVESSATAECDGDTQWGMDEHNDTLEDEAKRGEEDISELITKELEKGLLRNIYMMRTVKLQ